MRRSKSGIGGIDKKEQLYVIKLYVAGNEPNSHAARENLKTICNDCLKGRCQIDEVDILTDFAAALRDRIFVTPTLVLLAPEPRVWVIGNLADRQKVISALRLGNEYAA